MQVETGNWLGKPDGPQLTLIDTPGTGNTENMDCQYTMDTVKYLKDVVRRIDMFVLLFKGTNPRFDAGMQKQLELFETIFGEQMWKSLVTEITFWQYTEDSIEERERNQQSETQKHTDWNKIYRSKFSAVNEIPTLFIDPLFAQETASEREKLEFSKWTTEFWTQALSGPKPFSCHKLCKAPDSFFVGDPLILSERMLKVYKGSKITISCYVWTSNCNGTTLGVTKWTHNDRRIRDSRNTWIGEVAANRFDKYVISTLTIQNLTEEQTGRYQCLNSVGDSLPVDVTIKEDGLLGPWTEWSACSKSCVGHYERLGRQSRSRECRPARSGGLNCSFFGPLQETRSCAGESGLVEYCPSPAYWSLWTHWDTCSHRCTRAGEKPAHQTRRRLCWEGENSPMTCDTISGSRVEEKACQPTPRVCPDSIKIGPWSAWTECNQKCVDSNYATVGGRWRNRTCEGIGCDNYQNFHIESCNVARCPEDGRWQQWLSWTPCSRACGEGRRRRRRFCTWPRFGGRECEGRDREAETCNNGDCAGE